MSPERSSSVAARDGALQRVSRAKRWLFAGAVALTGVFSAVAANAFPGRTVKAAPPATTTPAPAPAPEPDQSEGGGTIQPPAQPPQPSDAPSGVVSGGS